MFTVSLILYVLYCYQVGGGRNLPLFIGIYFLTFQQRARLRAILVEELSNFVADVLEHPRVQGAAAASIVAGMNAAADQPDLPERAATIYLKLQEQNEHVSRQLGEQFPKVAASFLAGAAAGFRKPKENKNNEEEENNNNNKREGQQQQQQKQQQQPPDTPVRWSLFGRGNSNTASNDTNVKQEEDSNNEDSNIQDKSLQSSIDENNTTDNSNDDDDENNTELSNPPSPPPPVKLMPGLFKNISFDQRAIHNKKDSTDEDEVITTRSEEKTMEESKKDA